MIIKKRWQLLAILLAGLFLSAISFNAGFKDGRVVIGGDYRLANGETLTGDLVVIGGQAVLEENSVVQRNVALIGSSLDNSGSVQGDVVGIGSKIDLSANSVVMGRVVLVSSTLQRDATAQVGEVQELGKTQPFYLNPQANLNSVRSNWFSTGIGKWFGFLFKVFAWSALAVLLGLLFPFVLERIADAVNSQTVIALGVGFLTWLTVILAILFLTITLIFIPLALVVVLAILAGWLLGMVGLGSALGDQLAIQFHQQWSRPISAGLGTFILIFIADGVSAFIPCIGWVVPFLLGLIGFGAVVMTRFGSESVTKR